MRLKIPFLLTALSLLMVVGGLSNDALGQVKLSEEATQGKTIYEANCAICHKADSTEKTIGPGLKGLYARGVMADGTTKVTDETVRERIEKGKSPMPPLKIRSSLRRSRNWWSISRPFNPHSATCKNQSGRSTQFACSLSIRVV